MSHPRLIVESDSHRGHLRTEVISDQGVVLPRETGNDMDTRRRELLERIMADLAAGDRAMVFRLISEFGGELAAFVHWAAGRDGYRLSRQEVDDLVFDCADRLSGLAGSWRPDGGALPWVWARRALVSMIRYNLFGPVSVDPVQMAEMCESEDRPPPVGPHDERDWLAKLEGLEGTEPRVAAFLAAVEGVSRRNVSVFLEYRVQQWLSDPEPSRTVGAMFGLKPNHVRQIAHRVQVRLRQNGVERVA